MAEEKKVVTVAAFQDAFGMSQEAFGSLDGIQANWTLDSAGNVKCTLVVAGMAAAFEVGFPALCKAARPYIRSVVKANKKAFPDGTVKKATAGRGSTKPVLQAVPEKKTA